MIPVVVGADDYGIAPATSAVIRGLLARRRLTATGCMVVFPDWEDEGKRLASLGADADLGLHLTLTDQRSLCALPSIAPAGVLPSFPALARAAYLGQLQRGELVAEVEGQLEAFMDVVGRPPDYLDGHQHVHQLPVVRGVVVDALRRLAPEAVVRTCVESPMRIVARRESVGRAMAFAYAGRALRRLAHEEGLATTAGFTGVYDFGETPPYAVRARRFLREVVPGTFWMCHPGARDRDLERRDPLIDPRAAEARYFDSAEADAALAEAGAVRARLRAEPG